MESTQNILSDTSYQETIPFAYEEEANVLIDLYEIFYAQPLEKNWKAKLQHGNRRFTLTLKRGQKVEQFKAENTLDQIHRGVLYKDLKTNKQWYDAKFIIGSTDVKDPINKQEFLGFIRLIHNAGLHVLVQAKNYAFKGSLYMKGKTQMRNIEMEGVAFEKEQFERLTAPVFGLDEHCVEEVKSGKSEIIADFTIDVCPTFNHEQRLKLTRAANFLDVHPEKRYLAAYIKTLEEV
jgi:hypothetical protein